MIIKGIFLIDGNNIFSLLFVFFYIFSVECEVIFVLILCMAMLHFRAVAAAAFAMGEEYFNITGRGRPERNEFLAMVSGDKPNSASRQIYLTFPAESTFKDEDVSEYFR